VGTGQVALQSYFTDPKDTFRAFTPPYFPDSLLGITYGPDGNLWATELEGGVVAINPSSGQVLKRPTNCPGLYGGDNFCVGTLAFGPGLNRRHRNLNNLYTVTNEGPSDGYVMQLAPPGYSQIINTWEIGPLENYMIYPLIFDNAGVLHTVNAIRLFNLNPVTSAKSSFPVALGFYPASMAYQHISVPIRKK
jgi:hypothetical protein